MITLNEVVRYDKKDTNSSLDVIETTCTSVVNNWIHRERFLFTDEMIYLKKGVLYLTVNGNNYELHENQSLLIHRYSTINGHKTTGGMCTFYTVSYISNLDFISKMELVPITLSRKLMYIEELLSRLYDVENPMQRDNNKSCILFLSIIYEIQDAANQKNTSTSFVQRIVEYIETHIQLPLTVEMISEELNYNRDYVSKQFYSHYGVTLKQYIDDKKMSVIKQLLLTSDMSLTQIGYATGFENSQQFYKFFKYHEKMSPSKYREINL